MTVNIRGKNIDVTPPLKDYVEKKVSKVTKQFRTIGDISALMRVEKGDSVKGERVGDCVVEISFPAGGVIFRAQETTKDMYSSIDLVIEKIERQIHKYKTKLMRGRYNNFREETPAVNAVPAEEPEFKVVRSKRFIMRPMGVEEAIMQMNLLNHDFFVFFDDELEAVNVVYRRKDGDYGLLSPELK
ncbi:MAG: ribosome-associated translation inhibitor RaiA [Negativicutes bacterium]|nr:ribosome-associated translation inhibitor RaiA [Negativicutes bacterium]